MIRAFNISLGLVVATLGAVYVSIPLGLLLAAAAIALGDAT